MTTVRRVRRLVLLCLLTAASPAGGEMEGEDYEPVEVRVPARDLERRKREIEVELQAEARREEEARAAEEAARLARAAELAARPYGVRLLEARCDTVCHGLERITQTRHSWLGWQAVILRMEFLNGALLDPGERDDLAKHLAETLPAGIWRTLIEYGSLPLTLVLALTSICWVVKRR